MALEHKMKLKILMVRRFDLYNDTQVRLMVQCPRAKQEKPLRRGQTPDVEGIDWSAHASVSSRGCRLKSQHTTAKPDQRSLVVTAV